MIAKPDAAAVDHWLRRLTWALGAMPASEREDIVEEARGHLEERIRGGQAAAEALAGFGEPDVYARPFLDEMELSAALGSQRSGDLLGAVARRVHRSLLAAGAGLILVVLALVAFAIASLVIMKLHDPVRAGLWIGPGQRFIGVIDDPSQAREMLGLWLYPLAGASLALIWLIGRLVLLRAVRGLSRSR